MPLADHLMRIQLDIERLSSEVRTSHSHLSRLVQRPTSATNADLVNGLRNLNNYLAELTTLTHRIVQALEEQERRSSDRMIRDIARGR